MIVVADSSPIVALLKCDCIYLLDKLYGGIEIPPEVYKELTSNIRYLEEAVIIKNLDYVTITNKNISDKADKIQVDTFLDRGESEAIALAQSYANEALLLIDEKKGRKIALEKGIDIIGSLGVLYDAYEEKIVSEKEILECFSLLKESNIRVSDKIIDDIKTKITGKKRSNKYSR